MASSAEAAEDESAGRQVFERLDRDAHECQELLCQMSCQWLLSVDHDPQPAAVRPTPATAAGAGDAVPGLISSFSAHPHSRIILLVPTDDAGFAGGLLDMREVLLTYCFLLHDLLRPSMVCKV